MGRRRSSSGVTDFLSDLTDDIKDFVDDEIIDRGRDTERDVRRAGRNLTRDEARNSRRGGDGGRQDELDDLRRAIRTLATKVNALAESRSGSASAADELPIAGYDDLTVADIGGRLPSLTQADLEAIDSYERANANRSTLTSRIEVLRGSEPWPGYDEQTVVDIRKKLTDADEATTNEVRTYETRHKNRQGVLDAAGAAKTD